MGAAASGLECATCACSCENGTAVRKYADTFGIPLPPESAWCEELEVPQYPGTFGRKDARPLPPNINTEHGGRSLGSQASAEHDASSLISPNSAGRLSPGSEAPLRQSWQDLDANGNYNLHFFFKRGERFGLQLVDTSELALLAVAHVEASGPFAHTSKNSPGLFAGDVIMQVNRQSGPPAQLRDILNQVATNGGQLFIVAHARPAAFDVCLKRQGPNWKKLGLSVAIDRADIIPRMRVRTVRNEGLVPQWNESNGSMRICPGDFIMQVNGITKEAEEMYSMVQASTEGQTLELRIETPSRDAPRQDLDSSLVTPQSTPTASIQMSLAALKEQR